MVVVEDLFEFDGPDLFADNGLPMGLPRHCLMPFWPSENVCMFSADLIRSGTSLTTIFRVTLSRRNVRPLMVPPGLLVLPG